MDFNLSSLGLTSVKKTSNSYVAYKKEGWIYARIIECEHKYDIIIEKIKKELKVEDGGNIKLYYCKRFDTTNFKVNNQTLEFLKLREKHIMDMNFVLYFNVKIL